ncbi:MAG: MazG-like family protein [Hyphomonadaceae bacterium]|nr:MazG-like family protein [Clostridia bacterium]
MALFHRDIDITRNVKLIEWLKTEVLTETATMFKTLSVDAKNDTQDQAAESLANLVTLSYLLGKRLGVSFQTIDLKMNDKLQLGVSDKHPLEKDYGDLSELLRHLNGTRHIRS